MDAMKDDEYACLHCDSKFETLKELLDHVREEHC
jgi:hypothetical protein